MKRVFPILAVLVLIGILALLNKTMNKGTGDDDTPPPPPPAAKTAAAPAAPASDPLPPEITVGDPATARYKITVGWVYDDINQGTPALLSEVINAIRMRATQSGGKVSAEIVNLDMPPGELSPQAAAVTGLGVAVNGEASARVDGKEIALAGNPGEGEYSALNIGVALDTLLKAKP